MRSRRFGARVSTAPPSFRLARVPENRQTTTLKKTHDCTPATQQPNACPPLRYALPAASPPPDLPSRRRKTNTPVAMVRLRPSTPSGNGTSSCTAPDKDGPSCGRAARYRPRASAPARSCADPLLTLSLCPGHLRFHLQASPRPHDRPSSIGHPFPFSAGPTSSNAMLSSALFRKNYAMLTVVFGAAFGFQM